MCNTKVCVINNNNHQKCKIIKEKVKRQQFEVAFIYLLDLRIFKAFEDEAQLNGQSMVTN